MSTSKPTTSNASAKKSNSHGRARWLSVAMLAAVVLVSGTVVADVVLQYELSTNVGAGANSPFTWAEGSNYGPANGIGVLPAPTCATGTITGANCYLLTATVDGVTGVPTYAVNAYEFNLATNAEPSTLGSVQITSPTPGTQGGTAVNCAFAFISDANVGVAGTANAYTFSVTTPAGVNNCVASEVTDGAPAANAGCAGTGAGSTVGYTIVNLISDAQTGSTVWNCNIVTAGNAVGNTALSVSYFVWAPAAASTLTAANIYVSPIVT